MPIKPPNEIKHPEEECEAFCQSIKLLLMYGNYDGAKQRLEAIIKTLDPRQVEGKTVIADAINQRIANMVEKNFGIIFIEDMTRLSFSDLISVRSNSFTTLQKIEREMTNRGLSLKQ